jgi:hypothetical protein
MVLSPLRAKGEQKMNEAKSPFEPFFDEIRKIVRQEIAAAMNGNGAKSELLTPEQLAEKLGLRNQKGKLQVSWVYEQSRQGNIPTHRVGKYIRFDLSEVLESQKKKNSP